ncbi:hypothetical protein C5167_010180 [Papaver somniferum]|uniref:Thioredoxin domain-containing protein n=1 Tax=Papaver somniferum TaxID=3469 RepID=A0A4Y7K2K2_PAPSO|nr:thioredoxin H-type 1-like [Papaver somniferum]RZC66491.1 hypothetical protein C5167_010180 [Papaver somniferum]
MAAVEEGQVVGCHTLEHWTGNLDKGKEQNKLVVIDFTASWCGPCRMIAPILAEIAKKLTNVLFLKVDVDELQVVAQEWKVEAMPTFVFLKGGVEVDRFAGANKTKLEELITKHSC